MAYAPVNGNNTLAASVADLNNAFDLLLGLSHGTSVGSPEAYQPWIDTTSSATQLKIRNGGNSAWVPVHWLESQSGPIASNGTQTIKLIAPATSAGSYTLTLPNSNELPSSGTRYLKVDSAGNLSFTAS